MGYMRAHTIVVDSWSAELVATAHAKAATIFPWVSPLSPPSVNLHQSFFVPPDGSKEGWDESAEGDTRRAKFKQWLREQVYEDGSTALRWVEVQFADDENKTIVVDHDGNRT